MYVRPTCAVWLRPRPRPRNGVLTVSCAMMLAGNRKTPYLRPGDVHTRPKPRGALVLYSVHAWAALWVAPPMTEPLFSA
eukprot:451683-Prymnesium_polylepis.1